MWFTRPSRPSCHSESERMKAARLVVLTVAIAAGGVAAMLAGRSEKPPEVKAEAAPKMPIPSTSSSPKPTSAWARRCTPGDMQWQAWPASAATGNFIRKNERPNALEYFVRLDRARAIRQRRADPRSQAGQRQGLRLHGGDPAVRHARDFHADFAGDRRRRLHPAERSRRRHSDAPRPRRRQSGRRRGAHQRNRSHQHPRAGDRPERRGKERPEGRGRQDRDARVDAGARPKRWRCRSSSARCRWRCAASPTRTKTNRKPTTNRATAATA